MVEINFYVRAPTLSRFILKIDEILKNFNIYFFEHNNSQIVATMINNILMSARKYIGPNFIPDIDGKLQKMEIISCILLYLVKFYQENQIFHQLVVESCDVSIKKSREKYNDNEFIHSLVRYEEIKNLSKNFYESSILILDNEKLEESIEGKCIFVLDHEKKNDPFIQYIYEKYNYESNIITCSEVVQFFITVN
jgi:hypothetical protein